MDVRISILACFICNILLLNDRQEKHLPVIFSGKQTFFVE